MKEWPVLEREPVELPVLPGHDHTLLELAALRPRHDLAPTCTTTPHQGRGLPKAQNGAIQVDC